MRKFSGTMPQRPKRKLAFCPNSHSRNARGHLTSSKICVNLREKCSAPLAKATFFLEPSLSRVTSTYHKSLSYAKLHKKCHVPEVSPMFCAILKKKKCTRMSPGTTKMKICRENDPPQRPRLGLVMFCQSHCNRESHQQHTTKKNKIILYQNVHQKSEGNKSFSYVFRDPAESETSGTSHKQNHYPRILS
jgi:hypothetical protein